MADAKGSLTVLVADDHPVYRQGLERAIGEHEELELVGATGDGREALELIHDLEPRIAVVDVRMPGLDGLKIVEAVRRDGLRTRILLLTGYEDPAAAYRAITEGAAGYVSKASDHTELCRSIISVAEGETVVAPQFSAGIASEIQQRESAGRPSLSELERRILGLLAEGRTAARIGTELELTGRAVDAHTQRLYEKLGADDRATAVATAMRWGLLE